MRILLTALLVALVAVYASAKKASKGAHCFATKATAAKEEKANDGLPYAATTATAKVALKVWESADADWKFKLDFAISKPDDNSKPIIAAHVHAGNSTTSGAPIVFFCGQSPFPVTGAQLPGLPVCDQKKTGVYHGLFSLNFGGSALYATEAAFVHKLLKDPGIFYVNFHSDADVNGVIRGQLRKTKC